MRSTQPDLDVLGFEIFENGFARELKAEAAVLPSGIGRVVGVHCAVVDANGACFQRLGDARYRCVVAGEKIGDKAPGCVVGPVHCLFDPGKGSDR